MAPEVGQDAPDFTLPNQHGEPITLSSFRGSKNVVLTFYPWAFTGTCTGELGEIRDRLGSFDNDDTVTLAVSLGIAFCAPGLAITRTGMEPACKPLGACALICPVLTK